MKTKVVSVIATACVLLTTGCASILNEETQRINVQSTSGEKFTGNIDGATFEGPGIVEVKRANTDRMVNVETEGCAKQTVMPKQVDSVFFLNILTGGVFGSTTDYSTEKMWKYQDSVVINCQG